MVSAHHNAAMPDARCGRSLTMAKWLRRQILGSCFFQYDHVVAGRGVDSSMSANAAFAAEAAVTTNHDRQVCRSRVGRPASCSAPTNMFERGRVWILGDDLPECAMVLLYFM